MACASAAEKFQSTPPARGATKRFYMIARCDGFQSTPPARGATPIMLAPIALPDISIHAPREGGDSRILFIRL